LIAPVREITDRGGKAWRSYAALACCDVVLGDSRKFAEWLAFPEFMHVGSLIVDDVQDKSDVRRGGPTAHLKYGEAICINAGTAAYFMGERMLRRSLVRDDLKLELYDLYFEALREGHAGQAIDLDGLEAYVPIALDKGEVAALEQRVLAIHRLKTAAPASALARMGALVGGGSRAQVEAVGRYFDSLGLAFQIVDDVLNLKGFKGDLKQRGEDLTHGKVTLPVARALGALESKERLHLWALVSLRSADPKIVGEAIALIDKAGALDGCLADARKLIETAWSELNPLVEDSLAKVMLRAFGWYVLERHY
jgi:geranylgeranyl pyrophosphate synthase